jgi:hypothetical protein
MISGMSLICSTSLQRSLTVSDELTTIDVNPLECMGISLKKKGEGGNEKVVTPGLMLGHVSI